VTEIEVKSYRYLRMTIVVLLVGLGVAVLFQTWRQDFHLLGSISAYYYTPAQAIFVGALIGLAACMIALKGTYGAEDLFLNLGGMFAAVVAIVPSTRGEDFQTAVRACEQQDAGPLLTEAASSGIDCPTIQALAAATRANVENNMVTMLVVGLVGLIVTVAFAVVDLRMTRSAARGGVVREPLVVSRFVGGLVAAVVVWAGLGTAYLVDTDWFIRWGHYIAAAGLFVCVLVVTVANAFRRDRKMRSGTTPEPSPGPVLIRPLSRLNVYALLAWIMAIATTVMLALWSLDVVTLFWVEIVIGALFIAFWLVQTVELLGEESAPALPEVREPAAA
jgi:hypothetical protein